MSRHPRTYDLSYFPTLPGIYGIVNKRNGKVYVGSSLSVRGRLQNHRNELSRGVHRGKHLQAAWNKYGEKSFSFHLLEVCKPSNLVRREQYWMDALGTTDPSLGYNLTPAGPGARRGMKTDPAVVLKMSLRLKGVVPWAATNAAAKANKGQVRPLEVRLKISAGSKGKPKGHGAKVAATHWTLRPDAAEIIERSAAKHRGKKHTSEHKAKIGEASRRMWARRRAGIIHGTTS